MINQSLEQKIIRLFAQISPQKSKTAIGDDAALLPQLANGKHWLISTDVMIEGNHYSRDYFSAGDIAFKLVEKSVSDIYIKGGYPRFALLNLALKQQTAENETFLKSFAGELTASLQRHKMVLIGGDTSRTEGHDMFTLTILGETENFIPRKNGKISKGDLIVVQGIVGASQYALNRLQRKEQLSVNLKKFHVRPEAQAATATWIQSLAKAAIDQSDSLYEALEYLATNNKLELQIDISLIPTLPEISRYPDFIVAEYVLGGGEDFAAVCIISLKDYEKLPEGAAVIGEVKATNSQPAINLLYDKKEFRLKAPINHFMHFVPEKSRK